MRFCPSAWATHRWSAALGQRSASKLYYVERNRLWLVRALFGTPRAALLLGRTGLRYAAYLGAHRKAHAPATGSAAALAKAISEGLRTPIPADVSDYFRGCEASRLPRSFFASWSEELKSPIA